MHACAVINKGQVVAAGTVDQVAGGEDLDERFLQLVGGRHDTMHLDWAQWEVWHAADEAVSVPQDDHQNGGQA